jgi:tripartite-type tricarboxylate transporter receptor subunit TctC
LIPNITHAAGPIYEGKTIRIIVGFSPGGGFDTYARVIARHMGKHIPGHPTIIVDNMTGAGGLILVNHLYSVAKPDGLTIGHFIGNLLLNQVLGMEGAEFDARKFKYIGAAGQNSAVLIFSKKSGITSIEKLRASKAPVKMGGVAPGTRTDSIPRILKVALGLPIQIVSGYKGTADIRLAIEGGELAGFSPGWESVRASWRDALEAGDMVVVLQGVPKPLSEFPNVPLAINLAKTDEARKLIEMAVHSGGLAACPFVLPPDTPKERVQVIRKAFQETLKDKEFLGETEKAKLAIYPVSSDELEKTIAGLFKLDRAFIAKLKDILI